MSEDLKGSGGAPVETASGVDTEVIQTKTEKDVVAYETHKKLLSEAKRAKEMLELERAEKQKLIEEKLAAEGKKDELLESYKKKLADYEQKTKKVVGSFSQRVLTAAISQEAAKEGCVNVEDLIRLSDLSELADSMDEDFGVDTEKVKELVARSKKDRAYLFNKSVSQAKVGNPTTGVVSKGDEWKKLPLKEQALMAITMGKK